MAEMKSWHIRWNDSKWDLWLGLDTFEHLADDSCLPSSPERIRANVMNRPTLDRIQRGLEAGSAFVQKVAAFYWDSFTCKTASSNKTFAEEIRANFETLLMTKCFMHSAENRSVVIIGYNLDSQLTQKFQVSWCTCVSCCPMNSLVANNVV